MLATVVVNMHEGDLATTILAALGVVLALASLGWQAYSFLLSGSRVRVQLKHGMRNAIGAITSPTPLTDDQMKALAQQGYPEQVFGVEVHNAGRSPTSIIDARIVFGNGAAYSEASQGFPHRLEPETEASWYFSAALIRAQARLWGQGSPKHANEIRASVRVAGRDKPVISKNRFTV